MISEETHKRICREIVRELLKSWDRTSPVNKAYNFKKLSFSETRWFYKIVRVFLSSLVYHCDSILFSSFSQQTFKDVDDFKDFALLLIRLHDINYILNLFEKVCAKTNQYTNYDPELLSEPFDFGISIHNTANSIFKERCKRLGKSKLIEIKDE